MTDAKVLTGAELEALKKSARMGACMGFELRYLATIAALKAELALKDKVVEAARFCANMKDGNWNHERDRRDREDALHELRSALNDLDKVIAR